jgi:hypothetical protein
MYYFLEKLALLGGAGPVAPPLIRFSLLNLSAAFFIKRLCYLRTPYRRLNPALFEDQSI